MKNEKPLEVLFAYHKGWKDGFAAAVKIWQNTIRKAFKKK
jgi:hypothetical protein